VSEILTTADIMMCPHMGTVSLASSQNKVTAGGAQVLRPSDTFTVVGCILTLSSGPHPCIAVEWQNPSLPCSVVSDNVLTTASVGLCKAGDGALQGIVQIQRTQLRASAR
jgi:hypothetical protein